MRKVGIGSSSKPSTFLLGAVFIGIATLLGATAVSIGSREANATAAFAGQTRQACAACHVNPAGGGKLTARGQKFKANGYK